MSAQSKYYVKSTVQIVAFETDELTKRSRFILDKVALRKILNPHKDRKIVVVSVAGAYRLGKSFLLNIFLRYLQLASTGNLPEKGWLKRGGPLQGFESKGGTDGCTKGIWAYPDLFVFQLNDGSEVAVMLVDCQGAFDNDANPEECGMVFAFSMLMSSVQIYNVSGRIQRDNLENLQLFVAYAKLAAGEENGFKPFQTLLFIVRDFANSSQFAFGQDGGGEYLRKLLSSDGQSPQLQDVKEFVPKTFEDVKCYLKPYPGESVAEGRSDYMTNMKPEFAKQTECLTESLFHPDVLVPKRVAGQEITGSQLIDLLVSYGKVLENGNCIDANTILEIKANFSNNELVKKLLTKYTDLIERLKHNPWMNAQLVHDACKATVLNKFDLAKKLGGNEMAAKHREALETIIQKTFAEVCNFLGMERDRLVAEEHSELIRTYNSSMEEFINAAPANVPIDSYQLAQKHQQCRKTAVEPFEERVQQYRAGTLDYDFGPACEQLNRDIKAAYNSFVNQNNSRTEKIQATKAAEESEKKRREAERAAEKANMATVLLRTYNSLMEEFISAAPANDPIDSNQLSQKHQQCRETALKPFEERVQQYRSGTTDHDFGPALEQLKSDIEAAYKGFVNQNNERTEKIQAKKAAEDSEKKRLEAELEAKRERDSQQFKIIAMQVLGKVLVASLSAAASAAGCPHHPHHHHH